MFVREMVNEYKLLDPAQHNFPATAPHHTEKYLDEMKMRRFNEVLAIMKELGLVKR